MIWLKIAELALNINHSLTQLDNMVEVHVTSYYFYGEFSYTVKPVETEPYLWSSE